MTVPSELSVEAVQKFMLENGGKVTNHDLVKHFKHFLTNPVNRAEAREHFKEIVNVVATIRTEEGEKFLVLKKNIGFKKIMNLPHPCVHPIQLLLHLLDICHQLQAMKRSARFLFAIPHVGSVGKNYTSPTPSYSSSPDPMSPSRAPPPYRAPPPPVVSPPRGPPPVAHMMMPPPPPPTNKGRPPPITALLSEEAATAELARQTSIDSMDGADDLSSAPPVPPRRKSSVKSLKLDSNKENYSDGVSDPKKRPKSDDYDSKRSSLAESEAEHKISVRDAMQKFNRLASENELQRAVLPSRKKPDKRPLSLRVSLCVFADGGQHSEDDAVSVTLLDPKSREWLVRASQCDYHVLAKLAAENPRLATFRDPTSTALHWAAKYGNEDVIKLIAGTHQADVNVRSGYTPLHIAMQFGHEDIHNLLQQVYSADANLRDWSGRKPRQYQMSQGTSVSADTFRKIKAKKKHAEKDSGFLRIGSLNVRVKRTTEAFSNFLGVGQQNTEKIHKSWGSADNVQQLQGDRRMMPPPQFAPIKKRKSKRAQDFTTSHSTPSTPSQHRSSILENDRDSDSDTAAGFDSNWQNIL